MYAGADDLHKDKDSYVEWLFCVKDTSGSKRSLGGAN